MSSNVGMRKLVVIAVVALGLTGCANAEVPSADSTAQTTTPSSTTTTTRTSTSTSTPPTTTPSQPDRTSLTPKPSGGLQPGPNEVVLEGVVQEGVEAGCILLLSQGAQYLLLGGDPAVLRVGQRVIVRGKAEPGVATTCQQGVPFIVAEVRPG